MDQVTAARAMIHMSRAIKDSETNKKKEQSVSRQTINSVPSDSKSTDESMDVDGKYTIITVIIMLIKSESTEKNISSDLVLCESRIICK